MESLNFPVFVPASDGLADIAPSNLHSEDGFGEDSMLALKHERRVLLLRVKPRVSPAGCTKPTSLEEFIAILEAEFKKGTARCYVSSTNAIIEDGDTETERDEKNQIYLAQIRRDASKGTVTLLINRGNPNAVAPAFLKPASNDVKYIQPTGEETPGASAHLVISTKWETGGFHRGGFEKMPHVATGLTQAALNAMVDRVVRSDDKYTYQYQVKKGKKVETATARYSPILILERMPSEKLKGDLEHGELAGVTLTKKVVAYGGTGPQNQIRYQEQKLVIHTAHSDKTAMESLVANIETWGKEQSYEAITLHIEKLPHGQTSNPTLKFNETEEALEILYSRAQIVDGFSAELEGCYKEVCDEIEAKIAALVT